ncbi:hypothetical protein [Streptomyces sp. NPDC051561]|uniref:hypothetical protein n=1 Tax=Streptomyces sp. NPDC051561 TaxID=3365658 RepID=UPI0037B34D5A
MAEISYPFNADSASGGTSVVSQTQWQEMAHMWGGDRVDFQLTASTYSTAALPFNGRVTNNRSVEIQPGKAFVGGFYYQLTAPQAVLVAANAGDKARKDLVVIQADSAKGSVNLAVLQGAPGATPVPPQPRRKAGGLWEMPLFLVDVAARNASVTVTDVMPYSTPPAASYPWNVVDGARFLPRGSLVYDADSNTNDSQLEGFVGRDGYVVTRHFGKSRTYIPSFMNGQTPNAVNRKGRYRWIAPNTIYFSASIENPTNADMWLYKDQWIRGITLPVDACGLTGQVFTGHLNNNNKANQTLPNFVSVTGKTSTGGSQGAVYLYIPGFKNSGQGLDALAVLPRGAVLTISGTYEANEFKE